MMRAAPLALAAAGLLLSGLANALPWDKDMQDQPSVKAQETVVPKPPPNSVPIAGRESVNITQDIGEIFQGRIEAASLVNPFEANLRSIEKGRELFNMVCAVCHGSTGLGDGPVGEKFIARPFDLTIQYVQNKPDGELFFTITNGGVVMPYYRDALDPDERWHVVNFVKHGLTAGSTRP
jgi:mono/diheme cytochrome c family protein